MTLYRDDIQETIAYSNNTVGKSKAITEELIKIKEDSLYRLTVFSADVVSITDELVDSAIFPVKDKIMVVDHFTGRKRHADFIHDQIIVSDSFKNRLCAKSLVHDEISSASTSTDKQRSISIERLFIAENLSTKKYSLSKLNEALKIKESFKATARFKDSIVDNLDILDASLKTKLRAFTKENVIFQENYRLKKISRSVITETLKAQGSCVARYSDFIEDHITYSEQYAQRIKAKQRVIDTINVNELLKQQRKSQEKINETLMAFDFNQGKNIAKQLINDLVFIEDDYSKHKQYGYAWTANVDTWAMSRYQDYGFSELVVINGVLYGVAEDGVYRLDAKEHIEGELVTGQLDLGQGQLVHPLGAYLEYELSGNSRNLEIGVSATQSGSKQTYYYLLPTEKSDHLTNGRVLFGRGLRGRHFAFEIKISGEHAYINDLNIDISATKRRI
ncbi:hypothetical protein LZP46_07550 [Acinetobacter sp. SCLZS86]|uniref:hypothetical protein n=1 Tax=Acinetobacter sp. SCLZS86 TaxID=2908637 RepID=UPI001F3E9773|nr:hypothetical protein [Acinetobacter sp. SCLZS86]UIZ56285.1 hypothetical protein LZP46_07550 [Acinetobacter sp. SCLZS86]